VELQLFDVESLQRRYQDLHLSSVKFRHLTWKAKLSVLMVGSAILYKGPGHTAIYSPLRALVYRSAPGSFLRKLAKAGLI
jgi:hypothetical protein